jgi:hypothetical protein
VVGVVLVIRLIVRKSSKKSGPSGKESQRERDGYVRRDPDEDTMEYHDKSFFESEYKKKYILVIVNMVAFVVGLLAFSISCITGNVYGLPLLLLSWFIGGLVANIMLGLGMKSFRGRASFGTKIVKFFGELIGLALGCPVFIFMGLIGMSKVKKQIVENNL